MSAPGAAVGPDEVELERLARQVGAALGLADRRLALAESCTGGWIAQCVTAVAGSSGWFDRGFVTYSNEAKQEMLGVRADTLAAHGAVSEAAVLEMAAGALERARADVAVAVSGIAGPDGGSADKPLGTVWIAWAGGARPARAARFHYPGARRAVRALAVRDALLGVLEQLRPSVAGDA